MKRLDMLLKQLTISDDESVGNAVMAKKERQSNIELLRILAILGVIILHYNNPEIGGSSMLRKVL